MAVYCGIDWAEGHHDIALVDEDGRLVAKRRISESLEGLAELMVMLAAAGDSAEEPIPVAIETPRGLLVAALRATGRPVYPINPLAVARYRERTSVSGKKSDHVDAMALANILRTDAASAPAALRRHNLGASRQRVAALASLTAAETGQITEQALEGPFGFCLYASTPGEVVSLDTFYVGRLKGVGAVWQLTAVDVATRIAVVQLVVGDKTATVAAGFLDHLKKALRKHGITLTGVLSDNGPEFTGKAFKTRVGELGLVHHRIPPRSPNHNAVCGTVPRHRAAGVLPAPLPPRPRRRHRAARPVPAGLAGRLQPPPTQPRRLHGRPHPGPGQEAAATPDPADCSLTTKPGDPETPTCHPDPCSGRSSQSHPVAEPRRTTGTQDVGRRPKGAYLRV